jgi:hypothetical protein
MDTNSTDRVSTDFPLVYLGLFYPRNPADLGALPSPRPQPFPNSESRACDTVEGCTRGGSTGKLLGGLSPEQAPQPDKLGA